MKKNTLVAPKAFVLVLPFSKVAKRCAFIAYASK
jgi:hypothetical protein